MKILLLCPVWRRPAILWLMATRIKNALPDYAELKPVFIASPEDPDVESIRKILQNYDVFWYKNEPLGEKMNAGLNYISRYDYDYLMNIGSDNIWTPLLWEIYRPLFDRRALFFGINDFHVINFETGETRLLKNYNTGIDDKPAPVGAGRMIAREIIPEKLWRDEFMWGMDGASAFTLYKNGFVPTVVQTHGRHVMLNIMSRTNLTQWEEIAGEQCNRFEVRRAFGLDTYKIIEMHKDPDEFNILVCRYTEQCGSRQAAFEMLNEEYRHVTGELRFKTYNSFKSTLTKLSKR